jgi:hypothetical protein
MKLKILEMKKKWLKNLFKIRIKQTFNSTMIATSPWQVCVDLLKTKIGFGMALERTKVPHLTPH